MADYEWWQKAVFYQIYPRSFADGNGDGIGDLAGIQAKLDYLQWLGIDAIWLSPHYPSPLVDCGYDVSDYCGVAPEYGNLDQFKTLLADIHARNMRLVIDLVLNHTSDQHPWFIESRSSRQNPRRDWYIWQPGKNGRPPNDWFSTFGGPAWTFDETSGEYYYHYFFKEQPDLNWHNPEVRAAMFEVVRFWCELGVDGFRLDAVGTIYETPGFPDQATGYTLADIYQGYRRAKNEAEKDIVSQKWRKMFRHQHDLPEVHNLMRELRIVIDQYPHRVLIGETDDIRFYGNGIDELHLNFNFPLMHTNRITPDWVRKNQGQRLSRLPNGAWPCNTLGNHDAGRMMSEFGDGLHDEQIARVNLALLLTMWGTPFLYNGEEIGMVNHLGIQPEQYRDPLSINAYDLEINLIGSQPEEAGLFASQTGRDKSRTPMQWTQAENAGFCPPEVTPWLPVHPNYADGVNVSSQENDPHSLLSFYRQMLSIRKSLPALQTGTYEDVADHNPKVFVFLRKAEAQTCLVALNMSEESSQLVIEPGHSYRCKYSTHQPPGMIISHSINLRPFEVMIALTV